jgi:hypothetical protein
MRLVGLAVAAVGLALVVLGMWLIGVPSEFIGGVLAVCGLGLMAAGVLVDWNPDAKPS